MSGTKTAMVYLKERQAHPKYSMDYRAHTLTFLEVTSYCSTLPNKCTPEDSESHDVLMCRI